MKLFRFSLISLGYALVLFACTPAQAAITQSSQSTAVPTVTITPDWVGTGNCCGFSLGTDQIGTADQ